MIVGQEQYDIRSIHGLQHRLRCRNLHLNLFSTIALRRCIGQDYPILMSTLLHDVPPPSGSSCRESVGGLRALRSRDLLNEELCVLPEYVHAVIESLAQCGLRLGTSQVSPLLLADTRSGSCTRSRGAPSPRSTTTPSMMRPTTPPGVEQARGMTSASLRLRLARTRGGTSSVATLQAFNRSRFGTS